MHMKRKAKRGAHRRGLKAQMQTNFYVNAIWDPEASVWYSESDIPGLVIEADTLDEFESLMEQLAPEMLALNAHVHNRNVQLAFRAESRRELAIA